MCVGWMYIFWSQRVYCCRLNDPAKNMHILIPGTCECIYLRWQEEGEGEKKKKKGEEKEKWLCGLQI